MNASMSSCLPRKGALRCRPRCAGEDPLLEPAHRLVNDLGTRRPMGSVSHDRQLQPLGKGGVMGEERLVEAPGCAARVPGVELAVEQEQRQWRVALGVVEGIDAPD